MKVEKLLRYGIPPSVIESWRRTQGQNLLPLQAAAVTRHNLLGGQNLIISAPTSSGKTFCGEMAAAACLFRRKKVIFLVPLKAIAEEKYSHFSDKYGTLGIKVAISTRDRQEDDRAIEKGNFELAIMIYEKFNQLLIKNLDVLKVVDLIVVDELQMIGDTSRGSVLDLALTKIMSSGHSPQILGLSAVLKDADQLSSWLGCRLLFDKSRPVELLQGVLLDGKFHFRKYNSGEEGTQLLAELDSDESHRILFANVEKLLEGGEQILVFLKSKKNCEDCAFLLSEEVNLPAASGALQVLSQLENTTLKGGLMLVLQKGIAFHNADLTFDERSVIERFYRKGEIRAIFSTTTLALGINLPARTVFIETQKFHAGEHSGKAVMLPISWSEYENMSGRAGRFGLERDFGRSIIIAQNKFQFDSLWEGYVEGQEEKISSQLREEDIGDVILDLVTSGVGKNVSDLKRVMGCSLRGPLIPEEEVKLEQEVARLVEEKILLKSGQSFSSSRLGSLCAFKGISIGTALSIKKKLEGPPDLDPFGWFYSILNTKDGEDTYVNVGFWERQNGVHERALKQRYENVAPSQEEIKSLLQRDVGLAPKEARLVKLSSLLCEWITAEATLYLENKYSCRSGQIEQIGQRAGWLLDAACGIARVLNSDRRLVHFLKRLSLKTNFGVNDDGVKLARLRVPGLGRDYIWSLIRGGFTAFRRIREASLEELERVIPRQAAQHLKDSIRRRPERRTRKQGVALRPEIRITPQVSLVIDGTPVKDKFLVWMNGTRVALPAKSFKYLVKLARAVWTNPDGWIHKNDLEPGDNQTRYLHRLKKQMVSHLQPNQTLIENNRLGCYRLGLPKSEIKINSGVLRNNADAELRTVAGELEQLAGGPT